MLVPKGLAKRGGRGEKKKEEMGTANHDKLPPMGDSSTHVNTIEILYAQGEIHTALVRSAPSSATCSSGVIIVNHDSRFFFLKKKARKNEAIYQQERDLFPHQKSLTATAFIFIFRPQQRKTQLHFRDQSALPGHRQNRTRQLQKRAADGLREATTTSGISLPSSVACQSQQPAVSWSD